MAVRNGESVDDCQRALERQLSVLGRQDIGVGDVRIEDRRLVFTLWKGRFRLQAALPTVSLQDHGHFSRRMCLIVVTFNRGMRQSAEDASRAPVMIET